MEDGSKLTGKLTGGKKLRKDQCLIIILTGVLLCVIALPVKPDNKESGISDIRNGKIENHMSDTGENTYSETEKITDSYAGYWEEKLEEALRFVEGVGKVRVLITVRESEQKIVEKDGPETYSDTSEKDAAGGSRIAGESRIEKSTVYTTDESGRNVPYVTMTIPPAVEGVVVIAQGAQKQSVQENIIEAIQVLFDIDANKIKIVKMKNNQ
ncbi:MAG: stage III sporulation protein AG [Lachnospiraceae bacterium]|nr:stage III sporulation protein AG [Lachnospiraceae bacterium]